MALYNNSVTAFYDFLFTDLAGKCSFLAKPKTIAFAHDKSETVASLSRLNTQVFLELKLIYSGI